MLAEDVLNALIAAGLLTRSDGRVRLATRWLARRAIVTR